MSTPLTINAEAIKAADLKVAPFSTETPKSGAAAATAQRPTLDRSIVSVKRYVTLGFLTIVALFGGFGGWAATTDLDRKGVV